jgi:hypothetical protein
VRYFVAAGEAAGLLDAGEVAGALAGEACCAGAGVGVAAGADSGVVSSTEREPVNEGSDNAKAINMNAAAAPIVIFANRLAVPRGPNAVLDTLLENNAPASAFPGCKRMTTISTTQARIKRP